MATKTIDTLPTKANPTTADLLVIADAADNNEMKQITIGSITEDIGAGIINDSSASATSTYSSNKINSQITAAATPDATIAVKGKVKLSVAPVSATEPIAVGDNDTRLPTAAQVGYIPTADEKAALDGTGTPAAGNKFVTEDTFNAAQNPDALFDETFPAGEAITAGQAVFIEPVTTFAAATSVQNVGDVTGNTRISFPVFGSGVAGTTINLSVKKFTSPSVAFSIRIETDNAGSPSGTLATADSYGSVAAGTVTTSLVDTAITLNASTTLTAGTRYHVVCFAGAYGSETINATNYYGVGYSTNHTTTRPLKIYGGASWGAASNAVFCYTSSTAFNSQVLSLTDADYSYKVDFFGLSSETKAVGLFPKITTSGINSNQTGLTSLTKYYLSATPGALTSNAGSYFVGTSITSTQIYVISSSVSIKGKTPLATASTSLKYSADTEQTVGEVAYTKKKEIQINVKGTVRADWEYYGTGGPSWPGTSKTRIYVNGSSVGAEKSTSATDNVYLAATEATITVSIGDLVQLYLYASGTGRGCACKNFRISYDKTYVEDGIVNLN